MAETRCDPVEPEASRGHRAAMAELEASLSPETVMAGWVAELGPVMAMARIAMMAVRHDAHAPHGHGCRLGSALHS